MSQGTFFSSGNLQADRRFEYAKGFLEAGETAQALELLEETLSLAPFWPVLPFTLGDILMREGEHKKAVQYFEKSLELDPADTQGARVKLALLGAASAAQTDLPRAYVQSLFDEYAPRFDHHLVNALGYRVPGLIREAVQNLFPGRHWAALLDLGCGTGLAVEAFGGRKAAEYIEGVDLSASMLQEARRKGLYHQLVQGDLVETLKAPSRRFDLILAADVFNYLGEHCSIFERAGEALSPKGVFAFCTQSLEGEGDFRLGPDHRFSHAPGHTKTLLEQAGFSVLHARPATLRQDGGEAVAGMIFVAVKPC